MSSTTPAVVVAASQVVEPANSSSSATVVETTIVSHRRSDDIPPGKNDHNILEKNNDDNDDTDDPAGPSRDRRRRFKKLRKRAARIRPEADLSGIVKREEWEEVKQAMQQQKQIDGQLLDNNNPDDDFCPWIGLRQNKKRLAELGKPRDGIDHRLILKALFLQGNHDHSVTKEHGQNGRKRQRDDGQNGGSNSSAKFNIPPWVSLHNPVCVDHLAVLEIHIVGSQVRMEDVDAILQHAVVKSPGTSNDQALLPTTPAFDETITKWFEGPRPQSISDILLYEKPVQYNSRKKSNQMETPTTKQQLEETLQSLTLANEDLKREGYPMPEPSMIQQQQQDFSTKMRGSGNGGSDSIETFSGSFRKPSSFSLEEAKAIVEQAKVTVVNKDYHFVMTWPNKNAAADDNSSVNTKDDAIRVFGLDCEMVKTDVGSELARITLIQYYTSVDPISSPTDSNSFRDNYTVLMDELVLPYLPILDYVTAYSGITAALLVNVTTRLEQVQASLLHYINQKDIVVGHSLENDLLAARWVHPNVIDTAVLFRTPGRFKHSLKHLSAVLLNRKIQGGDHHCSEEDAAAALELAIRRAEEGPCFAITPKDRQWWIPTNPTKVGATSNATVFVGPSQWLQDHVTCHSNDSHALTCETIDAPNRKAILSWLTGPRRRAHLVWAHLVVETPEHVKLLRELLLDVRSKMSSSSVLMGNVQLGHLQGLEMSKRRRMCQNPRTTLTWTDEDEKDYQSAVDECRSGRVFWATRHVAKDDT